jgi:integrase
VRRLSARAVDLVIRNTASRAGLRLSAHVLRHTCVTNSVRHGNDIVLVAELAGHRRLETTRRYSLPSAADRQAAMDGLEIDPALLVGPQRSSDSARGAVWASGSRDTIAGPRPRKRLK